MIDLSSKFFSGITARIIKRVLKKKLGIDAELTIDECRFGETTGEDSVMLSAKFMVQLKKKDVEKLLDAL